MCFLIAQVGEIDHCEGQFPHWWNVNVIVTLTEFMRILSDEKNMVETWLILKSPFHGWQKSFWRSRMILQEKNYSRPRKLKCIRVKLKLLKELFLKNLSHLKKVYSAVFFFNSSHWLLTMWHRYTSEVNMICSFQ